jgi:hypothetical protein
MAPGGKRKESKNKILRAADQEKGGGSKSRRRHSADDKSQTNDSVRAVARELPSNFLPYGALIGLVIALWGTLGLGKKHENDVKAVDILSSEDFLSGYICNHPKGNCHPSFQSVPERRTHVVQNDDIMPRSEILVLPRERIITDLDAMRDPWIRNQLFGARHKATENALDSGAYLAAYLVRRIDLARTRPVDPMIPYFSMLPAYQKLSSNHPPIWDESRLNYLNGTLALQISIAIRDMIESEYEAFSDSSSEFSRDVSGEEYFAARLNVMARSFGTGPVSNLIDIDASVRKELEMYRTMTGVDLMKGCRALSPILDTWDHHPRAPTQWEYSKTRSAFIVRTHENMGIPIGSDVWVSYGAYTESHLHAKFGFTNADGSSHTEASIAAFHQPLDVGLGAQWNGMSTDSKRHSEIVSSNMASLSKEMASYLAYDDGYEQCIDLDGPSEASQLKRLKLQHLVHKANTYNSWNFKMGPREPAARPPHNSLAERRQKKFPAFNPAQIKFDGKKIISTCRLITLTEHDLDGNAKEILLDKLKSNSASKWHLERISEESEYRSLVCLARLAKERLKLYPTTVAQDELRLRSQTKLSESERQSIAVRIGEKQTLEMLIKISEDGIQQKRKQLVVSGREESHLRPRLQPCLA